MRAVLTLPMPGIDLTVEDVRKALGPTTWLPRHDDVSPAWEKEKIQGLLNKLPEDTQRQLQGADKVLVQVGFSVDGLVSLEREQSVVLRLFQEGGSVESIKDAVINVAQRLPEAFKEHTATNESPTLEPSIEIRNNNDGATVAKGQIVTPHTYRFWRFLPEIRPRENRLLRWLTIGAAVSFAIALAIALFSLQGLLWAEIRGYSERICSALLVAILTTFINLSFEYKDWRSEKTEVDWLFG